MSFIRKRQKNLIFAGVFGFFTAVLIVFIIYFVGVRGNIKIINWLLEDSQLEVNTVKVVQPEMEEAIVTTGDVYTLVEGIKKGDLVIQENILKMTIETRYIPEKSFRNIEEIIGKKALINIESPMILNQDMFIEEEQEFSSVETMELKEIHIPDLLIEGDQVNLRIHFPSGQDYLVLQQKEVIKIHEEYNGVYLELTEEEILNYSSAIVDGIIFPGTELYFTKYKESIVEAPIMESYDSYPLNPNVLHLSRNDIEDIEVVRDRMQLDISLFEYFDEDVLRYRYGNEALTEEELDLQTAYLEAISLFMAEEESREDINVFEEDNEDVVEHISENQDINTEEIGSQDLENQDSESQVISNQDINNQEIENQEDEDSGF